MSSARSLYLARCNLCGKFQQLNKQAPSVCCQFPGLFGLLFDILKMEAARSTETSVDF
jgi:hypothetical protein